jgi:hypothetical protein
MRNGCFLAILALAVALGFALFSTRSLYIKRGLGLNSYIANDFTFEAWSYSKSTESRQLFLYVCSDVPPYTLVLRVYPNDEKVESSEILAAFIIDKSGKKIPVLGKLQKTTEEVEGHKADGDNRKCAIFVFDKSFDSNSSTTLEIELRAEPPYNSEPIRQSLEIEGFESESRGFIWWDIMSSA